MFSNRIKHFIFAAFFSQMLISNLFAMAVVGDNSVMPLSDSKIAAKVGAIYYNDRPICTAFASAKNELTTAAHCIDDLDLHEFTFRFIGESEEKEKIIIRARKNVRNNMAVLKVNGIEDFFEVGELEQSNDAAKSAPIVLVGVDSKEVQLFQSSEGSLWSTPLKTLYYHLYDTVAGASGAPLIQSGKVVAMHLGYVEYQTLVTSGAESDKRTFNVALKLFENSGANLQSVDIKKD